MDQRAQHLALGLQFDQRKLDALVGREWFAERFALTRIGNRFVDAELRGAEARGGLADAVLVERQNLLQSLM